MHKIGCHCESCYMDLAAEKAKLQQENEELKNSSFPDQEIAKKTLLERDELLIQIQAQAERIEKLCVENSILWEKNRTQAERIEKLTEAVRAALWRTTKN